MDSGEIQRQLEIEVGQLHDRLKSMPARTDIRERAAARSAMRGNLAAIRGLLNQQEYYGL